MKWDKNNRKVGAGANSGGKGCMAYERQMLTKVWELMPSRLCRDLARLTAPTEHSTWWLTPTYRPPYCHPAPT